MVMARLHVICGNCGNGDQKEMHLDHYFEHVDDGDDQQLEVTITCRNCATIHTLSNSIQYKESPK